MPSELLQSDLYYMTRYSCTSISTNTGYNNCYYNLQCALRLIIIIKVIILLYQNK